MAGVRELLIVSQDTVEAIYVRSAAEAPEINGEIIIKTETELDLKPGDFIEVTITEADEHDLFAELTPKG